MIKNYCPNCMAFVQEGSFCEKCGKQDSKTIEIKLENQSSGKNKK
ncbi:hypothetical protein [Metabacillus kandeliae]|nr:hypothetical protein [Metabacillus kandeliae]